ncbi:hypothetical protein FDI85_gp213 [Erwinia phage Machina]|uniref:Uncharacterized protein n=1 Tax=Erwinia phage Machina TaxID=1883375 RepID=A0A1B2IEN9_9CAUD|nr:hypothetical protein FDI85_gp213 [Erwinia phage Machina]ANZ49709.1 hypothetical protein MACHINA_71 [Erwinia phage Machina]
MLTSSRTQTVVNVGTYQNPKVRYNRREDKVSVTSGKAEFTCSYLEFYALLMWARLCYHEEEQMAFVAGNTRYELDPPYGTTHRDRIKGLLEAAKGFLPMPTDLPATYTWDDEVIYGSDLEHIYLRESVDSWRPVFALRVTLPKTLKRDDGLALYHQAKETINEGRALPAGTEDISIIYPKEDAKSPTYRGINNRKIFEEFSGVPVPNAPV